MDIEATLEKIGGIPEPTSPDPSGVYLFTSFDLVNSTAYKGASASWPEKVRWFYDNAISEFLQKLESPTTTVWKYQGDEILFYTRISSMKDVSDAVDAAFAGVAALAKAVENATKGDGIRLSVKGACWIADAKYRPPAAFRSEVGAGNEDDDNLMFPSDLGGSRAVYDFLGPNIDAGFRVSSQSAKHLLVISAELGWLLSGKCGPDFPPRLRVVGYKQLKGVWSGRYYPIVVYHRDWNDLPKHLSYDDRFTSEVIRRASSRSTLLEQSLAKVFDETGRRGRVEKLAHRIETSTPPATTAIQAAAPDDMEVHCAAVCFNEHGDVLIGRRPDTKRVQAGKWEFGCGRLRNGQDFATCIKTDYLADFGVEVELIPAADPVPIRTYTVTKSARRVPGIIFVAKILGNITSPNFNREKHSDIKWLAPKDAANFEATGCVPDFAGTIEAAVRLRDQLMAKTA